MNHPFYPKLYLGVFTLFLWGFQGFASTIPSQYSGYKIPSQFPVSKFVGQQISFWLRIFNEFKSNHVVIHDLYYPWIIVDVINADKLPFLSGINKIPMEEREDLITKAYLSRYKIALERFHKEGKNALKYGAIENRIWRVYSQEPQALRRLLAGQTMVRVQGGLADEFLTAANQAQLYLPYMENVFKNDDLPTELTKIVFVESMFNLKAQSKVGASGIWQFMPETARQFMTINDMMDERLCPLRATHGAAKLLAENYKYLGSWPLAITAYNHGRGGMVRAVKALNTNNLDKIIQRFRSESFGFASRNFYSEFIASLMTYKTLYRKGLIQSRPVGHQMTSVLIPQNWTLNDVFKTLPISKPDLLRFNPCLKKRAFTHYLHRPLPSDFAIFGPRMIINHLKLELVKEKQKVASSR